MTVLIIIGIISLVIYLFAKSSLNKQEDSAYKTYVLYRKNNLDLLEPAQQNITFTPKEIIFKGNPVNETFKVLTRDEFEPMTNSLITRCVDWINNQAVVMISPQYAWVSLIKENVRYQFCNDF